MRRIGPNATMIGRFGGSNRFCQGFLAEFSQCETCKTCFEVGILLKSLFNLVDASLQCFASFKIGNSHVWRLDSHSSISSYCVAY